ncbi:hypothetical protein ACFLZZ_01760 [Nanoarchaeota archaeon]
MVKFKYNNIEELMADPVKEKDLQKEDQDHIVGKPIEYWRAVKVQDRGDIMVAKYRLNENGEFIYQKPRDIH